jgi:hypothetical protein
MSLVETSHGAAMAELSSMMVAMASSLEREEMGREKLTGVGAGWLHWGEVGAPWGEAAWEGDSVLLLPPFYAPVLLSEVQEKEKRDKRKIERKGKKKRSKKRK